MNDLVEEPWSEDDFAGLAESCDLAQALRRDPDDLRKRTLTPMVKEGAPRTAYPSMTDPRQAYTASTNSTENME